MKFRIVTVIALAVLASMTTSSADALIPGLNFLVVGKIELKQGGKGRFQAAGAPKQLNPNDEVRLRRGSRATILCSDSSFKSVPKGGAYTVRGICPQTGLRILSGGSEGDYLPTRGGDNLSVPFVISPRKTKILSDTPLIQWNDVPNTTGYTVRVFSPDGVIWEYTARGREIRYPGVPALQRGIRYVVEVRANTGSASTDEGIPGLAFSLIDDSTAQAVDSDVALLAEQELSAETEAFILAQIYRKYNLFVEAIAILEALDRKSVQSPTSYRLLGDLYRQVRLNRHAQDAYLNALYLAENSKDVEEKAAILAALGNITVVLDDIQQSIKYFKEARDLYFALEGENSRIGQAISAQLAELGL